MRIMVWDCSSLSSSSLRRHSMEFTLSDPPTHGYGPGDTVSGDIKYNIAAQQETILDVRLHLDGSLLIIPSKLKYEAHRSNITLVKESCTPFQGPFTLKRQLLVWPFAFVLPPIALVRDISVPLPPSIDHRFAKVCTYVSNTTSLRPSE